jgi:hypothetical protein
MQHDSRQVDIAAKASTQLLHYQCIGEDCLCGGMYSVEDVENGFPTCRECHSDMELIGIVLSGPQIDDVVRWQA